MAFIKKKERKKKNNKKGDLNWLIGKQKIAKLLLKAWFKIKRQMCLINKFILFYLFIYFLFFYQKGEFEVIDKKR